MTPKTYGAKTNAEKAQLDRELDELLTTPQRTIAQERRDARRMTRRSVSRVSSSPRAGGFGAWADGTPYSKYYLGVGGVAHGGKGNKHEEDAEQMALVKWFADTYPDDAMCLHASAGGIFAAVSSKVRMSRMGYKDGTPDFFLAIPAWGKPGAFIELKRDGGGVLSPEQKDMLAALRRRGYETRVCHGFREFYKFVEWWMSGAVDVHKKIVQDTTI